ncbi:immune inhibitor A domain-containing protein [Catellatospora tritici]|uniref:immune inhibitor A domain-containing protein n=1 Tax=Catellatospora tritici TaxID=2851566 RepID=UPI001C2D83D1|nr:immune inhibitor A domain-containing protein [Catellatospora tritici]MBV1850038.1 immune inhibitor A [Catellatospora tritici]
MRKLTSAVVGAAGAAILVAAALQWPAGAAPATSGAAARPAADGADHRADNRPGPRTKQWTDKRKAALAMVGRGQARIDAKGNVTVDDETNNVVEVAFEKTDKIFTILAEFGTQSAGKYGTAPGPLHNQIPQPDRAADNSTGWSADFSTAHYENLFNGSGESMKSFYEQLSSGKYSVTNTVSDWVQVPYNESYYGDNAIEDNGGSWAFIADTGNAWYQHALASMTPAQINAYLAQFDVWDRYDFDNDGNFDEPDGYLDHFQAVHAGEGEDAGGGAQGEDAIWSHRWFVNPTDFGLTGPSVGGQQNLSGGARIGNSNYWLGDYTTEPENGGLGVFAHEFGHDLGLPDYYDTNSGDNSTSFWTLMSSGSWLGHGAEANEGIGTTPGLMGPEEKLFLGWLDYRTVATGQSGSILLDPAQDANTANAQAIKVNLPPATTSTTYTTPASGQYAWWTGSADQLNESLSHAAPAASKINVTAKAWYDIESGYDYLYFEYSTDGGATWAQAGQPITGSSSGKWTTLRYSYTAGGAATQFRFRYQTDGGVHFAGAFLDDITAKAGNTTVFTDDVEQPGSWIATGQWQRSTGTVSTSADRYYLLENRQYTGYDDTLRTGPYQFSYAYSAPNKVEFFPFQPGMLVWYVNHGVEDNNTSQHPGTGLSLPVDARPVPLVYADGTSPTNRRQPFDATFGVQPVPQVCLHKEALVGSGKSQTVQTLSACASANAGIPTFNDTNPSAYYYSANPTNSVLVAGHGVTATVTGQSGNVLTVNVVNPA